MRKFRPGEHVTPKQGTAADRLLIYYARYYRRGVYGEQYRGLSISFKPGMVGVVRSRAPSVFTSAPHEEFLVIDFCEPITGKVQRAALHDSELLPVDNPEHEIPRVGEPIPEVLVFSGR